MNIYAVGEDFEYRIWSDEGLFYEDERGRKAEIFRDCTGDIDAAVGESIYILSQSKDGDLVLFKKEGEGWLKTVILRSKNQAPSAFSMRLMINGEGLHGVYGLNHSSGRMIVHQRLPKGQPQVIMQSCSEKLFVLRDDEGCIYAVCEALPDLWQMCYLRFGVWSAPETIAEGCGILDIMCKSFKDFCFVYRKEGRTFFENGTEGFEVPGENPYIIYSKEYKVLSEEAGCILYTGNGGSGRLITAGKSPEFRLRLMDSGEWSVCNRCRGDAVRGRVRLYLLDGIPRPQPYNSSELMKHTLQLEARIAELEKIISSYKPQ